MRRMAAILLGECVLALMATTAAAQSARPAVHVEGSLGYARFVDDVFIGHLVAGGGIRASVRPRISIGPEITYMRGPDDDRDWFITGNAVLDLAGPDRRATPYLLAGGGVMIHRDRFASGSFTHSEGALTGGGGVRLNVGDRWSIAPEMRIGWEPHLRYSVTIARRF